MTISTQLQDLGITPEMLHACALPAYPEADQLVAVGPDMFGRPQQMTQPTFDAWQTMLKAANLVGIELQLVSAYRSVQYQCEVIARKLSAGRSISEILTVNAPPGHSEHHTGRALDLSTPGCEPLSETFEYTPAFRWLSTNASRHGFSLSYPRANPSGIAFEPWHWAYHT